MEQNEKKGIIAQKKNGLIKKLPRKNLMIANESVDILIFKNLNRRK